MTSAQQGPNDVSVQFVDPPTRTVAIADARFVYRELGTQHGGIPVVGLTHLGANLDSWDPEVVDALAESRWVILIGYRGVGASTGSVQDRFEDMAADVIAMILALGLTRVDVLGISMGGMVGQEVLRQAPELVERVIFAGTGPQGGPGLTSMTAVMVRSILRGLLTFTPVTTLLFFTRTSTGRQAATAYQARLKRRYTGRDKPVTPAVLRAQLRAVNRWGHQQPAANTFTGPALILHGGSDRMVPRENVEPLISRFPHAELRVFADSGHGVVPQNRHAITDVIKQLLQR
ncbi:alpha/beta hydrolase [Arthrobacter psychrolactophilus]|uniref:Alpha/beta hydrolase n=1 Tax=Arthrobacter psychrolactophilus TaxID=92442 RepID=A0A2V5J798_9MICC|nr:alpha/beta hydrolase [Arthrobacter psychrolactophilus]PYI38660.1 alpha/beta hydrolase [Arthrobacter psychrolactophilus]